MINVWRFNEDYMETFERPIEKPTIGDVLTFQQAIGHHKSGISCLTYDGINCIVSGNTQV